MEATTRDAHGAPDVKRSFSVHGASNGSISNQATTNADAGAVTQLPASKPKQRRRKNNQVEDPEDASKRRCVSTACIACR